MFNNSVSIIIKIDSAFWRSPPHCERTITYEYTNTDKIETKIEYDKHGDTIIKITLHYNNDDKIVKRVYWNATEYYMEHFYFYENDKLTKEIINYTSENTIVITYYYNEKELLKEEQISRNDKITKLTRYFYE